MNPFFFKVHHTLFNFTSKSQGEVNLWLEASLCTSTLLVNLILLPLPPRISNHDHRSLVLTHASVQLAFALIMVLLLSVSFIMFYRSCWHMKVLIIFKSLRKIKHWQYVLERQTVTIIRANRKNILYTVCNHWIFFLDATLSLLVICIRCSICLIKKKKINI